MRNLQLTVGEGASTQTKVTAPSRMMHVWLRNRRRLSDVRGILARRQFKHIRNSFYDNLWKSAAADVGASISTLPNGLKQITRGSLRTFVDHSEIMLDSAIVSRLMLNKAIIFDWLSDKGLRVPQRQRFDIGSISLAMSFLNKQPGQVVVKPADGTGCGHGVTTRISTPDDLLLAARHAAAFHADLLVEEQLVGSSYRLLYLDGEFIDAVRRDPPMVVGDGHSTIRKLIAAENDQRSVSGTITALSPLMIDLECRNTLAAQGMTPTSIPASGQQVTVKLAVNENGAAQNHVVREQVHPDLIAVGQRIVREFGIGFAGLDVTAADISMPPEAGDVVFNEINAGPGIHHHYLVAEPERVAHVAAQILEHMFSNRRGVIEI